jgi:hypothetical protein
MIRRVNGLHFKTVLLIVFHDVVLWAC